MRIISLCTGVTYTGDVREGNPLFKHRQPIFILLKHKSIRRVTHKTNWDFVKKLNFGGVTVLTGSYENTA